MPRQRKAQNGAQRFGTGRVANTTTGSTTTQTVYRIPTGKKYGECDVLNYEVVWTSPVKVVIEGTNVYRVSLDEAALKNLIENYEGLDLSNVTLQTVNGNVTFTGNITAEWTFTWTTVSATTVEATTWNITNVTSSSTTTGSLTTDSASLWTATANWFTAETLNVSWTSTLSWNVTTGADLFVAWDTSTWTLSATSWNITTLTSTDIDSATLDVSWAATVGDGLTVTGWTTSDTVTTSWDVTVGWDLSVTGDTAITWTSTFTGAVTAGDITSTGTANLNDVVVGWNETVAWTMAVTWATTLNNTLTVAWASTLSGNASVGGNLSVAGNSTVTGNQTVTGDAIFSDDVSVAKNLTVSGDVTITDDLTVNSATHLKTLETSGSTSIGWNLSVDWSIAGWSSLVVENQIESGSLVTTNITTDNITINGNIALWNDATAPDFILQDEKWAANGVAPLDANGKIDTSYLPPVYTTAIVKMWTGVFPNSDTSTVVDADITANSFVILSNYQDIVWDLNETISVWQITVVSNQTETWSYKYIIVNPLS